MSTVTPPPPQPPAPSGGAAPQAAATVPQAPAPLQRLPAGEVIELKLLAAASRGGVEVSSPQGTFQLRTPLPLPEGSTLLAQKISPADATRPTVALRLIGLDGKPLAQGLADLLSQGGGGSKAGAGASPPSAGGGPLTAGLTRPVGPLAAPTGGAGTPPPLTATLIRPLGTPPPFPAGTQFTATFAPPTGSASPAGGPTATPSFPAAPAPASATTPAVAAASPSSPSPSSPLPVPGSGVSASPGSPATSPVSASSVGGGGGGATAAAALRGEPFQPFQITGTVAPNTALGQPLLSTPLGLMSLAVKGDLPPGSSVTLSVTASTPPAPASASPPLPPPPPGSQTPPTATAAWGAMGRGGGLGPALGDSLDLLNRLDQAAARQLLTQLPTQDSRLLVSLAAAVQAGRTGDARHWPGEPTLRALDKAGERGRTLARALAGEVREMTTQPRDASGGEWRAIALPFVAGGEIDRISLITRRLSTEEDEEAHRNRKGKGGGTRFLINLSLSALGAMQVDGLYREDDRRLDLIIRTPEALPPNVRLGLKGALGRIGEALRLTGGMTFAVGEAFVGPKLPPLPGGGDPPPSARRGGVVV